MKFSMQNLLPINYYYWQKISGPTRLGPASLHSALNVNNVTGGVLKSRRQNEGTRRVSPAHSQRYVSDSPMTPECAVYRQKTPVEKE